MHPSYQLSSILNQESISTTRPALHQHSILKLRISEQDAWIAGLYRWSLDSRGFTPRYQQQTTIQKHVVVSKVSASTACRLLDTRPISPLNEEAEPIGIRNHYSFRKHRPLGRSIAGVPFTRACCVELISDKTSHKHAGPARQLDPEFWAQGTQYNCQRACANTSRPRENRAMSHAVGSRCSRI